MVSALAVQHSQLLLPRRQLAPGPASGPAKMAAVSASRYVSRASSGSISRSRSAALSSSAVASLLRVARNEIWPRSNAGPCLLGLTENLCLSRCDQA